MVALTSILPGPSQLLCCSAIHALQWRVVRGTGTSMGTASVDASATQGRRSTAYGGCGRATEVLRCCVLWRTCSPWCAGLEWVARNARKPAVAMMSLGVPEGEGQSTRSSDAGGLAPNSPNAFGSSCVRARGRGAKHQ